MIAKDLNEQQALDAASTAIQQINFAANLDREGNTTMVFIIEQVKESVLDFSQRTVKVLWIQFHWVQGIVQFLSV